MNSLWPRALQAPGVDEVMLAGDGASLIGGKKQHDAGDVLAIELALETLRLHQARLALGRQPEAALAFRKDPARRNRIDPDVVGTEVTRQRPRQPENGGLGRRVGDHAALARHPRRGAEI